MERPNPDSPTGRPIKEHHGFFRSQYTHDGLHAALRKKFPKEKKLTGVQGWNWVLSKEPLPLRVALDLVTQGSGMVYTKKPPQYAPLLCSWLFDMEHEMDVVVHPRMLFRGLGQEELHLAELPDEVQRAVEAYPEEERSRQVVLHELKWYEWRAVDRRVPSLKCQRRIEQACFLGSKEACRAAAEEDRVLLIADKAQEQVPEVL